MRGTCYRDISETDPDFPEQCRMDSRPPSTDNSSSLQRDEFMETDSKDNGQHVQPMSGDNTSDWAEQMQQESDDKKLAQQSGMYFILPTQNGCGR